MTRTREQICWDFLTGPLRAYYRSELSVFNPQESKLERRFGEVTGLWQLATDTPMLCLSGGRPELRGIPVIDYLRGVVPEAASTIISWFHNEHHPNYSVMPAKFALDGDPFNGVVFLLPHILENDGIETTYALIDLMKIFRYNNEYVAMRKIPGGCQLPLPFGLLEQMPLNHRYVGYVMAQAEKDINKTKQF